MGQGSMERSVEAGTEKMKTHKFQFANRVSPTPSQFVTDKIQVCDLLLLIAKFLPIHIVFYQMETEGSSEEQGKEGVH